MAQLLLFEESQEEKLERRMRQIEEKYNSFRKGQWAIIKSLESDVRFLKEQLEFLQSNIARKGYYQ